MPFRPRGRWSRIYRQLPGDLRLRSRVAIPACYCNTYRRLFDTHALNTASKCHTAGVHGGQSSVSKNLPLLLAKDEILVNVVSPGSIASESLVGWATSVGVDGNDPYQLMDAIAKHFGHAAHMPRAGLPDEMGSVVAFLASRRNSYMTGANVNVDGGSDFT
jgi:NAD(P)-dependent dehydrogenase (short-subunit alcohol dehydrogenase family)